MGESHGIASLLDTLDVGQIPKVQHLLVPRSTANVLQAEDLNYLKEKGAFSLPTVQICNALVESYFGHVHPTLPIVDEIVFLKAYKEGGVQRVNLLLLWSMFSASSSYVADSVVLDAGFVTKVQMKESFLKRAKCLFNFSEEDNKIVLVQSALLISFWFRDVNDSMQTWHWTGIAFGLAQTMGLHRDPDAKKINTFVSIRHRRLWRRIWWSCVFRDSWLALLMGRPLRINTEDCDCPMPTKGDFADDYQDPSTIELLYLWLDLLELTKILRDILILSYRQQSKPSASQITSFESQINNHAIIDLTSSTAASPVLMFHRLQLKLYQQVTLIALFRRYTRHQTSRDIADQSAISPTVAVDKVRDAASSTNSILEQIIAMDGIKEFGPMTVSLLPPAMQVHLMESKSRKTLPGQLASNKLDICLMVLAELRDNYPSSTIIYDLFTSAKSSDGPLSHLTNYSTPPASTSTPTATVSNNTTSGELLQESPPELFSGFVPPLPDFSLSPSMDIEWPIQLDLSLEPTFNAILSQDELTAIFG